MVALTLSKTDSSAPLSRRNVVILPSSLSKEA